jgi:hypothetical protein
LLGMLFLPLLTALFNSYQKSMDPEGRFVNCGSGRLWVRGTCPGFSGSAGLGIDYGV